MEAGAQELGSKAQPGMMQLCKSVCEMDEWGRVTQRYVFNIKMVVLQAIKSWFAGVLHLSQADRVVLCT